MVLQHVLLVTAVGGAWAHGRLTFPSSRQGGSLEVAGTDCGWHDGNTTANCECCWYTDNVKTPNGATMCDPQLVTSDMAHSDGLCEPPCCPWDWTKDRPWRAPGSAPNLSPCGVESNNPGTDGRDLPPTARTVWHRGTLAEVAWASTANHGGGYAYRLCPGSETPTEACFQANHLTFAEDTTTVRFTDGRTRVIPATRTTNGTTPAGSQWTKNPIPNNAGYFPPSFPEGVGDKWQFSLVDRVVVPKDLALGDYVLSWRWDCELTQEIFSNCGDITVTDGAGPPPPPPVPTPPPALTPVPPPPKPILTPSVALLV